MAKKSLQEKLTDLINPVAGETCIISQAELAKIAGPGITEKVLNDVFGLIDELSTSVMTATAQAGAGCGYFDDNEELAIKIELAPNHALFSKVHGTNPERSMTFLEHEIPDQGHVLAAIYDNILTSSQDDDVAA